MLYGRTAVKAAAETCAPLVDVRDNNDVLVTSKRARAPLDDESKIDASVGESILIGTRKWTERDRSIDTRRPLMTRTNTTLP